MGKFIDLTGQKFGRLTALRRVENKSKHTMWLCRCDCGNEVAVDGGNLRKGLTKSCGCYNRELASKRVKTHGLSHTPLHEVWKTMKSRCLNSHTAAYRNYGAEGKTVCEEWLNDFQAFYNWAIANGYKEGLTIDRENNDKGYSPENCRWVTMKKQNNNKRNNHLITYNGKTQTIAEWADEIGIKYFTLYMRINRYHWTIEKALTTK